MMNDTLLGMRKLFTLSTGLLGLMLASVSAEEASSTIGNEPIGWASVEGGATGGKGGPVVRVSDEATLVEKLKGNEPATIIITGPIVLKSKVRVGSNKTVIGEGSKAKLTGSGLHLSKVQNVIIRNLAIHDSDDDAIGIEGQSHHIWVDHCDLAHSHDGLLDIKHGSDLITVSWCHFHNHHKTCLLGHSDKQSVLAKDKGKLRVTYHHNFFDGSETRHPRVRIAETVHIFNNYYRGNDYGAASTNDAGLLVEGNYFEKVKSPTYTKYGDSKVPGRLVERHNLFVDSGKAHSAGSVKEVSYKYRLDKAEQVAAMVQQGSGVGKVTLERDQGHRNEY